MKRCTIDGCERTLHAKGLCNLHRQRLSRHGDPLTMKVREKGQGSPTSKGYWLFVINGRKVLRHILIAERALGRTLPDGVEVHHVDRIKSNDAPNNLVICEDHAYHQLLHQRSRALESCGNPRFRKCVICKRYDDPSSMRNYSGDCAHESCKRQYNSAAHLKRRTREQEKGLL
jgi:hypothetical protein